MEWHPVFDNFKHSSKQRDSTTRTKYPPSYDFGTWGVSTSLAQIRAREANTINFWTRGIAPHVVERNPRSRSIPAFPGYDPSRDSNYFDPPLPGHVFDKGGFHKSLPGSLAGSAPSLRL